MRCAHWSATYTLWLPFASATGLTATCDGYWYLPTVVPLPPHSSRNCPLIEYLSTVALLSTSPKYTSLFVGSTAMPYGEACCVGFRPWLLSLTTVDNS